MNWFVDLFSKVYGRLFKWGSLAGIYDKQTTVNQLLSLVATLFCYSPEIIWFTATSFPKQALYPHLGHYYSDMARPNNGEKYIRRWGFHKPRTSHVNKNWLPVYQTFIYNVLVIRLFVEAWSPFNAWLF